MSNPPNPAPSESVPDRRELMRFVELHTRQKIINARVKALRIQDPYRPGEIRVTVGEILDPRLSSSPDEPVWAIFETGHLYMIVTPNRGGLRDAPYLYRKNEVVAAE